MADGKQWYNSPQGGNANRKKTNAKPGDPAKRSGNRNVKPAGKKAPVKPAGKPVQKSGKDISPVKSGDDHQKSIIPQMDPLSTSSSENKKDIKTAPKTSKVPAAKSPVKSAPSSAKKPVSSAERAKEKEQAKIAEQKKRREQAKLKEQEKIEKNEYKRKNPSQKSAESRAIRNGVLGAVAVAAALLVLVFVVHHLYDYIAEKPNFSFVTTGAVEHTIGAKALIVRDEDTINSEQTGELVTQITEGSRVASRMGQRWFCSHSR